MRQMYVIETIKILRWETHLRPSEIKKTEKKIKTDSGAPCQHIHWSISGWLRDMQRIEPKCDRNRWRLRWLSDVHYLQKGLQIHLVAVNTYVNM